MRTWHGGLLVKPEKALTGTPSRHKILPRVINDIGYDEVDTNKPFGPLNPCIGYGLSSIPPTMITTQKKCGSTCVYNYEDRFCFSRIITGNSILFDSHFEGGNLMMACRRREIYYAANYAEYDLKLHHDVHSVGHTQWFYFSVSNTIAGQTIKFNIGNFSKSRSLFNHGMRPLCYSKTKGSGWDRIGENICYYAHKRNNNIKNVYTLTFTHTFQNTGDTCYIASSYPYTYSDLQDFLYQLQLQPGRNRTFRRSLLCRTLAGNRCDLLTVTEPTSSSAELQKRLGVVITSRVHPGETNASWICQGIINFLTGKSEDAKRLRNAFVFKIVPMLNPDGVVNGNYRTSLAGVDLNRRWHDPNPIYHPTIHRTKSMVRRFQKTRDVITVCDIHCHSRKEGLFMYGCAGSDYASSTRKAKRAEYTSPHTFCRLFDNRCGSFLFQSCNFKMQGCKTSTMRVVMNQELGIMCSYTLETSLSGCNGEHFSIRNLLNFGVDYCLSMLDFLKILNMKGEDLKLQTERLCPKLMKTFTQPLRRMSNMDVLSEEESVGSDSNPSEDNLSESEVLMLLAGHLKSTKKVRGRKVLKKKKKVRRKFRNGAVVSNTRVETKRKTNRALGPLRRAEPNKSLDVRSDVKRIYIVEFPQMLPKK